VNGTAVAFRYARALLESAEALNRQEEVRRDLEILEEIFTGAPPVREYCLTRRVSRRGEPEFVRTAFLPYLGPLTGRLVTAAVENGRLAALPLLPEAFRQLEDEKTGRIRMVLQTAGPADGALEKTVRERMELRTGKPVLISRETVPELRGGVRILWKNRMLDLSLAGRLRKFRALLMKG